MHARLVTIPGSCRCCCCCCPVLERDVPFMSQMVPAWREELIGCLWLYAQRPGITCQLSLLSSLLFDVAVSFVLGDCCDSCFCSHTVRFTTGSLTADYMTSTAQSRAFQSHSSCAIRKPNRAKTPPQQAKAGPNPTLPCEGRSTRRAGGVAPDASIY